VAGQIVHHDDVTWFEFRHEQPVNLALKDKLIHWSGGNHWGHDLIDKNRSDHR